MRNKKKIKKPKVPRKKDRVSAKEPQNTDKMVPLFSFERIQPGNYCFSCLDKEDKHYVAEAIFRRKSLTWEEIRLADRHGVGTEKIEKHSIKAPIPSFITDDVDTFLAIRFHGMKPMIGYRVRQIFYVLWFDRDFTLYDH